MNIIEKFAQAVNYRDYEKVTSLFHANGKMTIIEEGKMEEISGPEKIKSWLQALESEVTFTFENIQGEGNNFAADFSSIDGVIRKGHWDFTLDKKFIIELKVTYR